VKIYSYATGEKLRDLIKHGNEVSGI